MASAFRYLTAPVFAALVAIIASPAAAQTVQVLGDYSQWSAFTASESGGAICFAMSQPTSTEPTPANFGKAYIYLTTRVAEGVKNEFNLIAGYEFAPDSTAELRIGNQTYKLYTQADAAWLQDVALADTVAGQMRAGSSLVVVGTNAQGQTITQTFSLSGVTAASRAVDRAC